MSGNLSNRESGTIRILLVDDDEDDFRLTQAVAHEITSSKIQLDWEADFDSALASIRRAEHDVYLVDYHLGLKTGLDLIAVVGIERFAGPVILLTGQGEPEIDRAAQKAGAADYLEKSRLDAVAFERMIRYAMRQYAQEEELERKVVERTAALELANRELRESDRRKDEFLATLAHELRNPLAPIRHAVELQKMLAEDAPAVEQARNVIERQLQQMVRLIDDLLDASRLNRGKLSLSLEPVDLRSALMLGIETSQPRIDKAGLSLTLQIPEHPLPMLGDGVRLAQIITNILNNSAKYTERGGKILTCVEQQATEYQIRISDNGIGILPENLGRIFDLFTQVDRTLNRQEVGLGIGLALVRRLVELHGGRVKAESPGLLGGTTITLHLPNNLK